HISGSLTFFVGSLFVGWWLNRRGILTPLRTARLVNFVVKCLAPFVLCFALWRVQLADGPLRWLPFIGIFVAAATLLPARVFARRAHLTRPQTGSFLPCGFFSNLGFLGAFMAFVLFGEEAYGLSVLYMLFFIPCFYTFGFGIAARYGHRMDHDLPHPTLSDDLRWYPFAGMVVGILLSLFHIERPTSLTLVNQILIPVDTGLYLMAIGSQLTFGSFGRWRHASFAPLAVLLPRCKGSFANRHQGNGSSRH
ncbi:MAG: hypothetical protein IH889_04975, partial [Planctomycetes bacterium]|nr:hypothetical protein [Planctomycetota bacterium]